MLYDSLWCNQPVKLVKQTFSSWCKPAKLWLFLNWTLFLLYIWACDFLVFDNNVRLGLWLCNKFFTTLLNICSINDHAFFVFFEVISDFFWLELHISNSFYLLNHFSFLFADWLLFTNRLYRNFNSLFFNGILSWLNVNFNLILVDWSINNKGTRSFSNHFTIFIFISDWKCNSESILVNFHLGLRRFIIISLTLRRYSRNSFFLFFNRFLFSYRPYWNFNSLFFNAILSWLDINFDLILVDWSINSKGTSSFSNHFTIFIFISNGKSNFKSILILFHLGLSRFIIITQSLRGSSRNWLDFNSLSLGHNWESCFTFWSGWLYLLIFSSFLILFCKFL